MNDLRKEICIQKNLFKKVITLIFITLFFVVLLALTVNGFLSNAKSSKEIKEIKYYTSILVESGDTLWSIASENQSYHYKSVEQYVKEVTQINSLMNENIKAGQYLIIPYYAEMSNNLLVHK